MSPQARMAAGNAPLPDAGISAGSDAEAGAGPFVINLTSSTTPMALAHPEAPELKRFSFFVSRRREDNRERFRLHMGYFATLAEAEEWLNVIRDLYPGAWAGEAPGKKLRARAAAAELAKQLPAPPTTSSASSARPAAAASKPPVAPPAAARTVAPTMPPAAELVVPTLQAAPTFPPASQAAAAASAAPMLEAVAQAAAALAAAAKTVAGAQAASPPISFTYAPAPNPLAGAPVAAAAAKAAGAVAQNAAAQISAAQGAGAPVAGAPAGAPSSAASKASATPAQVIATRAGSASAGVATPAAQSAASRQAGARASTTAAPASVSTQAPTAPAARAPAQQAPVAAAAPSRPAAQSPAKGGKKTVPNALTEGSNVREVMASLDETGETRQMRVPPGLRAPSAPAASPVASGSGGAAGRAPSPAQSARGSASVPRAAAPASRVPSADSAAVDSMSDTQVLRMLETRRPDDADKSNDDANSGISLLKPDDTQTRRALKEAVIDNAPVSFAVQLQWSVQPVDLASVPPLAIFSAYTLYTVEGSREGRKWYGLRLGFFSDAISAKQVAYYVRSEFNSVAVVPVSPAEKSRATDEETKAATGAFQRKNVEKKVEEFKLFDDEKLAQNEAQQKPDPAPAAKPTTAAAAASNRGAPARKTKPLGRVRAKEQRSPKTLEETLEILGASDLEIDNGRGEVLNDTGVRHLRVEVQKNTPFAKLLDRISERVRKN